MDKKEQAEQFKEIVKFLGMNRESRDEALSIIMNYTATYEQRRLWVDTEVDKHLLRVISDCIEDEPITTKALESLINLSNDKNWVESLCTLNVGRRVFEFLMHNVKPSQTSVRTQNAEIVKVQMTEEGGTTDFYEIQPEKANSIQCAIMLLSNVSMLESGQQHLLGSDKKTKGAIIENLTGMFTYFRHAEMFDFVANILANVSSLKAGRCWMIENGKNVLSPAFLLLQDPELSSIRIRHLIQVVRNLMFEYENYEKDFIQMEIVDLLVRFLVKEHGLTENSLPESWERMKGIAAKEKFAKDVDSENTLNLLDCLMLLANSRSFLKIMEEKKIGELFEVLKIKPFGAARDRCDVIVAQIMELSLPPQEPLEVQADDLD